MSPDVKFLLLCLVFSFVCALIKQLYNARFMPKKSAYAFIIDVIISGIAGIVTTLMLFEYVKNRITLMGISGLGGMFGLTAIKMIMKFQLGKKINIKIGFEDDSIIDHELTNEDKIIHPHRNTNNQNHNNENHQ